LVGPRVGLDAVAKRKMSLHFTFWKLSTDHQSRSLVIVGMLRG